VVLGGGVPFGLGFLDEVRAQYDSLWGGYLDLQKRAPLDLALTTLDSALVGASYLAKFMLA
jgi:hypothetical protein